jgi:Rrf2 family protein
MRINTKVRYAIRMMADIARHGSEGAVALKDVAARQQLPKLYLSQLAGPLKNASLLRSVWGNKGGYTLERPAARITLQDIMEAVDGPIGVLDCVLDPNLCERADYCECIGVWRQINEAIVRTLEQYTLADLVDKTRRPSLEQGRLCRIDPPRQERPDDMQRKPRRLRGEGKRKERPVGMR